MIKTITAVLCLLALSAGAALAQSDGHLRVTLLTEQAQRALRVAKSTCFVMSGSQSQLHAETALHEAQAFEQMMKALIDGAADPALSTELSRIQRMSFGVTRSAEQIVSGDFHSVPMRLLLSRNQDVADGLLAAARAAGPRYLEGDFSAEHQAALLHLAGQRILIEELLRDLCYVRLSLGAAELPAQMIEKIAVFESINTALIEGDAVRGLPGAPNIGIKLGLGQVASKWVALRDLLAAAANGEALEVRDLQKASVIGETLSQRLTRLMGKYAAL